MAENDTTDKVVDVAMRGVFPWMAGLYDMVAPPVAQIAGGSYNQEAKQLAQSVGR